MEFGNSFQAIRNRNPLIKGANMAIRIFINNPISVQNYKFYHSRIQNAVIIYRQMNLCAYSIITADFFMTFLFNFSNEIAIINVVIESLRMTAHQFSYRSFTNI